MNLPGYEEAIELGYELHSYEADRTVANYTKDRLHLTIRNDGAATLWAGVGLVDLSIAHFAFPHPRFRDFEKQIETILAAHEVYIQSKGVMKNEPLFPKP